MLTSTVNNLNESFSLCDLDHNDRETDASTVTNDDASANLFDDTRSYQNLYDCSSFAESVALQRDSYEADASGHSTDVIFSETQIYRMFHSEEIALFAIQIVGIISMELFVSHFPQIIL